MFDIVLKNAKIIDGTGNPWYIADIGIIGDKIEYIGNIDVKEAKKLIDVKKYTVTPGFIDYHSHTDLQIFSHSSSWNKLEQGITTEVGGNCGSSIAPIPAYAYEFFKLLAKAERMDEKTIEMGKKLTTFGKYIEECDKIEMGPNLAVYLGHMTIRSLVMGDENRKPNEKEMQTMKDMVAEAMESGAAGLTTGLVYAPGIYADVDEIAELCKVVKKYGGSYASHIRSSSYKVEEAIEEAIEVGRRSGVPVIISHHKVSGKENWGKAQRTLDIIEEANKEGIETGLDQYPYLYANTALAQAIHPKYKSAGLEGVVEMLKDPDRRKEMKEIILNDNTSWENFHAMCGFEGVLILASPSMPELNGRFLVDVAKEKNMDNFDLLFDILLNDKLSTSAAFKVMCEEDVETILKYERTMIGTDGSADKDGEMQHPRAMGTYPRILGKYVREKKILKLEDAIRKMTSLPANRLRLKTKGLIREGFDADLVVFDEETIIDKADYNDSKAKNEGIKYVFVNGQICVEDNNFNGTMNGKILRLNQ